MVLKKGDYVINPNTSRPVIVGGETWKALIKSGHLKETYVDDNILDTFEEGKYEEVKADKLKTKIKEINKTLPSGVSAVLGRGKYANKIVKRKKPLNLEEITKSTIKKAARAAKIITQEHEGENMDGDELEAKLEKMIMDEMLALNPTPKKKESKAKVYKYEKPKEATEPRWTARKETDDDEDGEDNLEEPDDDNDEGDECEC